MQNCPSMHCKPQVSFLNKQLKSIMKHEAAFAKSAAFHFTNRVVQNPVISGNVHPALGQELHIQTRVAYAIHSNYKNVTLYLTLFSLFVQSNESSKRQCFDYSIFYDKDFLIFCQLTFIMCARSMCNLYSGQDTAQNSTPAFRM